MTESRIEGTRPDLKRIRQVMWALIRPHRGRLLLAALGLMLAAGSALALGQGLRTVIDRGFAAADPQWLDRALAATLGLVLLLAAALHGVVIDGSEGATVQLASCCCPVPGDPIAGYLGRGEGLVVHTQVCGVGKRLFERDSERWIDVSWSDEPTRLFETVIKVLVTNGKGVLAQVAASISSAETDITHIEMGDERLGETAELKLTVAVRDTEHLTDVMRTLRRCPVVLKVDRV